MGQTADEIEKERAAESGETYHGKLTYPPDKTNPPEGLYMRYTVAKADGSPVDPRAMYFVLRLDQAGDDQAWIDCCRESASHLVAALNARSHLPLVAHDLMRYLENTQTPDSPPLRFGGNPFSQKR